MSDRKLDKQVRKRAVKSRLRGKRREAPRHLRRAADALSKTLSTALLDFVFTAAAAEIDISVIDRDVVDRVAAALIVKGQSSAAQRIAAWRRAIDALPADAKELSGIAAKMVNKRGKRTLSEPDGTFPLLESDIHEVVAIATRPRADAYDPHTPVKVATATAAMERMLIIAATLYRRGEIDENVRLVDLLAPDTQAAYIQAALARVDPEHDDADVEAAGKDDETAEPAPDPVAANGDELGEGDKIKAAKKGVWIGEDLGACVFFASRLWGPNCDAVVFANGQRSEFGMKSGLTTKQVRILAGLTQPSQLAKLRELVPLLMGHAESETHFVGSKRIASRLRSANMAVALAVQMELLLLPGDLVALACPADEPDLVIPCRDGGQRQVPRAELSGKTRDLLSRRDSLRAKLGRSSRYLFAGDDLQKPQDAKSVCKNFSMLASAHGLKGLTIQVLRDVGAIALINDDRTKLRRVMVLLRVKSVRTVARRYAPFLKDVNKNG